MGYFMTKSLDEAFEDSEFFEWECGNCSDGFHTEKELNSHMISFHTYPDSADEFLVSQNTTLNLQLKVKDSEIQSLKQQLEEMRSDFEWSIKVINNYIVYNDLLDRAEKIKDKYKLGELE